MKKLLLILLLFVTSFLYSQSYHIKSDIIKRHIFNVSDSLYYLEKTIESKSEFIILTHNNKKYLFFIDKDNIIRNIHIDSTYTIKDVLFMDSYNENTRFVLSTKQKKFAMYIIYNQQTNYFDWYLEFDTHKLKKTTKKKFEKLYDLKIDFADFEKQPQETKPIKKGSNIDNIVQLIN